MPNKIISRSVKPNKKGGGSKQK
jgi:hypothetical protein